MTIGITIFVTFLLIATAALAVKKKQKQPLTLEQEIEGYNKEIERILGASPKGYNLNNQMATQKLSALRRLNKIKAQKEEERRAAEYLRNREAAKQRNIQAYKNRTL